ncbi:MAG: protease inhibitor I42 family protein [Deltaproteobacteria bacterium]|nr:protease inhibitor I42 family protein [Deltaproteobacteria bacterium]
MSTIRKTSHTAGAQAVSRSASGATKKKSKKPVDTAERAGAQSSVLGGARSSRGKMITGVRIGEDDAGKTITVKKGENVIVKLPANATTGYQWKVTSTDKTFGHPVANDYIGPGANGPVGAGGVAQLIWKTDGFLDTVGTHKVELQYVRPFDPEHPAKKFTFNVKVEPAEAAEVKKLGDGDNGKTIKVKKGEDVVVELSANATTGYKWQVKSTDKTFGHPSENEYVGPGAQGPVGSGGHTRLVWKTDGFLDTVGTHKVELEYVRPFDPTHPAKKFRFTVEVEGSQPSGGMGIVAPTESQRKSAIRSMVKSALFPESGEKSAEKLSRAPSGWKKAERISMSKAGLEANVNAYSIKGQVYASVQSLFPPSDKVTWYKIGHEPVF